MISKKWPAVVRLAAIWMLPITAVLAANTSSIAQSGAAPNYPTQPVRLLVGFPAGSGPDGSLRVLADRLSQRLSKPFLVENVAGAGGNLACERAAKSNPDGHTLVLCTNGTLSFSPSLMKMGFDPVNDLLPISQVSVADNLLVVPPSLGVKTVAELIALAKSKPGELKFAHAGVSTTQFLGAALFRSKANIDIQPIPYRGASAAIPDLITGRVDMFFANIANALPLVKEGKLVALASAGSKRSVFAPDIPTMGEQGFEGFNVVPWYGLMAPAGTPGAVVDKLYAETSAILAEEDVKKQFASFGFETLPGSPDKFAESLKSESAYWSDFIRKAGLKATE